MKPESEITTADAPQASVNFRHPPAALSLDRGKLEELRGLLRTITDTAGREEASESSLDVCGRYASRALALLEAQTSDRQTAPDEEGRH